MSQNKLPKDWKWVKLGDLVEMQSGMAFKKAEYSTEGVRLFQIANVSFNYTKWDDVEHLPIEYIDSHNHLLLKKGDIVLALNRPMLNNHLKIAELKQSDVPTILYQRVGRFIFDERINKRYFLYYFQSPVFLKWLGEQLQGVNIPFINKSKLFSYDKFPLPPSTEYQQAIVSNIEEHFSELDKGIEVLKTAQQQLKTYRQSVLKYAFEGKLTNENVKDGKLPEGWEAAEMGNICSLITDGKHGNCEDELNSGYFFLSAKDVKFDTLNYENARQITKKGFEETHKRTNLKPGDICMVNTGASIGRIALAPYNDKTFKTTFQKSVAVIKTIPEILDNKYCSYALKSDLKQLMKISSGTAVPNLLLGTIKKHQINLPSSLEEQHQIVQEIESRLSVADKMEESITQSLQQAEALRQSILKKAFSGELV